MYNDYLFLTMTLRASFLDERGVMPIIIQYAGSWTSDRFLAYIRKNPVLMTSLIFPENGAAMPPKALHLPIKFVFVAVSLKYRSFGSSLGYLSWLARTFSAILTPREF